MALSNYNPNKRIVPIDYLPYLSRLRDRYKCTKDTTAILKAREEFGFSRSLARKNVVKLACQIIDNVKHIPKLRKRSKKGYAMKVSNQFFASQEWKQLRYIALKNAGGCCQCCGAQSTIDLPLHVDHIKPRSRYPELELEIDNLQVLCPDCNQGKCAWDDTDWRRS